MRWLYAAGTIVVLLLLLFFAPIVFLPALAAVLGWLIWSIWQAVKKKKRGDPDGPKTLTFIGLTIAGLVGSLFVFGFVLPAIIHAF